MPPRIARSSVATANPKNVKNKSKKRQLDAYAIASHSAPDKLRIRQHRLGETIDDEPRQKRRRLEDDDEDSAGEERIDSARRTQSRNVNKRTGTGAHGGLDEEDVEYGSDSSGHEWTAGGLASGESDEEIDSDEAFGESDEERFEGWSFRGSKAGKSGKETKQKPKRRQQDDDQEMDLNESAEEEEAGSDDSFGEEGVDLATMLDAEDEDVLGGKDKTKEDFGEESASDDEESEDADSESSEDDEEPEEDDEERHARLQDFVEALDAKPAEDKDRIVSGEDGGLTVDDLLADTDLDKATLATFRPKKKSKAPQTLKAPLPKRQQDRIDREIATQKAKEQLDRWRDTVIQNRRAEFLQFPLRNPDEADPIGKDKFVATQDSAPRTDLEQNIAKIMEESGMTSKKEGKPASTDDAEADLLKAEELATNKLPVEEVLRRRADLRRARELLFREEVKAKRIAKIKSKSYRRVHRKEKERQAEKERALLDPEGLGIEMDEDEKELADRRRAEARMGAKHKDSKWARSLKATNRDVWDEGARESAIDQARRQEELRKRVAGRDVESGAEESEDDDEEDDSDEDAGTLKQIDRQRGQDAAPEKGIGAMKFMRDADERRRKQNDEALGQMRRDMAGEESEEDEDEDIGRAIFGPASKEDKKSEPKPKRPELEEGDLSEEEEAVRGDGTDAVQEKASGTQAQPKSIMKKGGKASGPLAQAGVKDRRARARDSEAAPVEESNPWLAGPSKGKAKTNKTRGGDEATLVSLAQLEKAAANEKTKKPSNSEAAATNGSSAPSTDGWKTVPYNNEDAHSDQEEPDTDPMLNAKQQKAALYARAFAGDDVQAQFDTEKADLAAAEDEQEISTALPGWGSWTGSNLSKSAKKQANRQRHNPLHKQKLAGIKQDDRKDKRLENVIVSERQERKGKKYLAPVLPHGFERGEEYERSLRLPLGGEWGTKETVQRNTRPRVVVRPGKVVEAMERPMV